MRLTGSVAICQVCGGDIADYECDEYIDGREIPRCPDCGVELHRTCMSDCPTCGHSSCKKCMVKDYVSGEYFCGRECLEEFKEQEK